MLGWREETITFGTDCVFRIVIVIRVSFTFENKIVFIYYNKIHDSSVGIEAGYGPDDPGLIPGMERIFSSSQLPDRLWVPLNLLFNRHGE
jgi:hypothetical protein